MKKLLLIMCLMIICLSVKKNSDSKQLVIPSDSIRLRIISNSNSEFDINKKMDLKKSIEDYLYDLIKDASSRDEVDNIIVNSIDEISKKIYNVLQSNNYKIDYGQNYFPSKVYKGTIYDAGIYDSLVITLGNGKGSNWWCVLFPPLCLIEENSNTTDVEYQFFVSRIINKFE